MATFAAWLSFAQAQLTDQDSARLDAELLLASVLKKNRSYLYAWPEKALTDEECYAVDALLSRRLTGEPVAYILGTKDFWSLSLKVNASVLIPRPETELLVELALNKGAINQIVLNQTAISQGSVKHCKVMDLGTGSGAIVLALKKEQPAWDCWACDQSAEALEIAQENAYQNNIMDVNFIQSDWFANVQEREFDLIVSNPPYIDPEDMHLLRGDLCFEPRSALVASENGLRDIKIIVEQSKYFLKPHGWLLLEHGFNQGAMARELLIRYGYKKIETHCDLAGLERVTCGCLEVSV